MVCPQSSHPDLEAELHSSLYWRSVNSQIRRWNRPPLSDSVFFTASRTESKAYTSYIRMTGLLFFSICFPATSACVLEQIPSAFSLCVLSLSHRETNRCAGTHFSRCLGMLLGSLLESRPKLSRKVDVALFFFRLPGI